MTPRIDEIIKWLRANAGKIESIPVGYVKIDFAHRQIKPKILESHPCLKLHEVDNVRKT